MFSDHCTLHLPNWWEEMTIFCSSALWENTKTMSNWEEFDSFFSCCSCGVIFFHWGVFEGNRFNSPKRTRSLAVTPLLHIHTLTPIVFSLGVCHPPPPPSPHTHLVHTPCFRKSKQWHQHLLLCSHQVSFGHSFSWGFTCFHYAVLLLLVSKLRIKQKHKSHTTKLSISQYTHPVCLWSIPVCLICRSKLQQVSPSDKLTFPWERWRSFTVLSDSLQRGV